MDRKTPILLSVGMVLGVVLAAVGVAAADPKALPWHGVEEAAAPPVISYQGQVAVSGSPYSGTGYFKFAIVDVGGSKTYWANDGQPSSTSIITPTTSISLTVANGLFNVLLGDTSVPGMLGTLSVNAFNDTLALALRVWFSTDNATYYQLTPDRRITWAPLALLAQRSLEADTVDGLHAYNLLNQPVLSASNITTGTLATGRYSAHDDLLAENYLANEANNLAQNNGILQTSLNADQLDGLDWTSFVNLTGTQTLTGTKVFSPTSGAPFSVTSSTLVTNLNADKLDGLDASALRPVTATYQVITDMGTSCQAYPIDTTFAMITITTPGPGTIIVEANAYVTLSENVSMILSISDTRGDCGGSTDAYPTRWQTTTSQDTLGLTFPVRRVFSVPTSGSHTYYLNGQATAGTLNEWRSADLLARYYP